MSKERQSIKSSIIEISSKDNVSKEVTMLVHKIDFVNGNGLDFKEVYVEQFKDTLVNKPVVAKYYPLQDDLGDHEPIFDEQGNIIGLETIAIGTIKEVWVDDFSINSETTVKALYAKADLWNYKYPQVVSCVEKLFSNGNADTSVEVEIYSYGENPTASYRYATDYVYIGNCILGSNVPPADSNAGVINVAFKEVAMAVNKDLNKIKSEKKGVVQVSDTTEVFNKGFEVKFHGELETSALKFSEIRNQIYNILNPLDPKNGSRRYNYYLRDLYNEYVIAEDWDNEVDLYRIPYTIENDMVIIAPNDQWQKGQLGFIPEGVVIASLITEKESAVNTLQIEVNKLKEEIETMSQEKKLSVEELETKVTELNSKIEELNGLLVSEKEAKTSLEGQVTELNSKVEELEPFKAQVEKAEKDAKITELSSKYSKLLSEETFKSEEVQKAINELNSVELNSIVVNEIAKEKVVETSSKGNKDEVIVVAAKQEDLVEHDKKAYWAAKA